MHLSSDIFTQSIATKLRSRQNRLLSVLKTALTLVKLPQITSLSLYNNFKSENNTGSVQPLNINTLLSFAQASSKAKDILNNLLESAYQKSSVSSNTSIYLKNKILRSVKYKNVSGVRFEAAGRLSRRLTASRSVFKLKYKGSVQNIDSSFKGIPSVMLRGIAKPNLQYTNVNSKTRNGAFGLKG